MLNDLWNFCCDVTDTQNKAKQNEKKKQEKNVESEMSKTTINTYSYIGLYDAYKWIYDTIFNNKYKIIII